MVGSLIIHPEFFGKKAEYMELKIGNLLNNTNQISTAEEIQGILQCNRNILAMHSLLHAIPKEWKNKINSSKHNFQEISPFHININKIPKLISNIRGNNIYWELMNEKKQTSYRNFHMVRFISFPRKFRLEVCILFSV